MTKKSSLRSKLQQQHPAATKQHQQHHRQNSLASSAVSSITEGLCFANDKFDADATVNTKSTMETKGTQGTFTAPPTTTEPMIPGPGTILCFTCDPNMDHISVMNRTFESSDSFDNLMCSSPRMFMSSSIEKLCSSFDTLCFPCNSSGDDKVKPTFSPPTADVLATTPHPLSPESEKDLSKKMDELLKLLKEKETASVVSGAEGGSISSNAEKIYAAWNNNNENKTTTASPSPTKTVDTKSPAKTVNTNAAVLGDSGRTKKAANNNNTNHDAEAAAGTLDETTRTSHTRIEKEEGPLERSFVDGATTKLIGLVKTVSNSFKNLNESAISQDGSVVGIGLVPTFSADFDDHVEVNKLIRAETTEAPPAPSSTEKNKAAKPTSSGDVKNTSLSYSILSGSTMTQKTQVSQNPPVVVNNKDTLTKTDELAFEFNSKGLSISGEQEEQQQASDDAITPDFIKPPLPLVAAKIKAPRQGKGKKKKMMKKLFSDMKNVSSSTSTTTKSLKKITEEDGAEDKENMDPNVQWEANFSSTPALDSMGFPVSATSPSSPVLDSMGFPVQSLSSQQFDDNLFAASSVCLPATAAAQTQICAWCKKGGNTEKKLKLCSACQSTYYCR